MREAYDKTAELNAYFEKEMIELRDKLLASDDLSPDAKKLVISVEYVIGGSVIVHQTIARYKDTDKGVEKLIS